MELNEDEIFEDAAEEYGLLVPSQQVTTEAGSHSSGKSRKRDNRLKRDHSQSEGHNGNHDNRVIQLDDDISNDAAADGDRMASEGNNNTLSTNSGGVFDEIKFYSVPTIPTDILEKAKSMIYERIEEPLRRLMADDGPNLFVQYYQERNRKKEVDEEEEQRSHKQNLEDLLVRGDPREYQRHLLEIALEKNTIINLGTGAGKTLIALMCIKEKRAKDKDKKQTLFLVPSVALAIQHGLTLQSNLPNFKIETAYYARSGSQNTRSSLVDCDVLVATHGVMLDLLMHWGDMFSLDRFNLVVIDECHYACGSHPYRHLMTKFYHTLPPDARPHILGLTASPLISFSANHTDQQLSTLLDNLEETLDARLASVCGLDGSSDDDASFWQSRTIVEDVLHYQTTNTGRSIPSAKNLKILPSRYRELDQLEHLYKDLGPLVLRAYCQVVQRELSRNYFESESKAQFDAAMKYLKCVEDFCDQEVRSLPTMGRTDKLLALEQLVESLIENQDGKRAIGLVFVERRITAMALHCYFSYERAQLGRSVDWLSAVQARRRLKESELFHPEKSYQDLCDTFEDSIDDPWTRDPSIPNRKRKVAQMNGGGRSLEADDPECLHGLEKSKVASVVLVRNPTQIFNSLSISQKNFNDSEMQQHQKTWVHKEPCLRDTLASLRSGNTNLLFATSVVEEGVDVQACSFVVAFDGLRSVKGYVQMKGRARQEHAKFFLLHDPLNHKKGQLDLSAARKMEIRVENIIQERMRTNETSSFITCPPKILHGLSESREVSAVEAGVYKVGEAIVDLHTAKSLVHRYYLSLPAEALTRRTKALLMAYLPVYENDCLELPSHFPQAARTVVIPDKYKDRPRREKEKILSLMAVVRLHSNGLLNERLLPLTRKDLHDRILPLMSEVTVEPKSIPLQVTSRYDEETLTLHAYPLKQYSPLLSKFENLVKGGEHCLGLLLPDPINSFDSVTLDHTDFGPVTLSFGEPVLVDCTKDQRKLLDEFFVVIYNYRWSRRKPEAFNMRRKENKCNSQIAKYFIGILSETLSLDFETMIQILSESKRSFQERKNAVLRASLDQAMPHPRIWSPIYSQFHQYIVSGPSGKTCGAIFPQVSERVKSFKDYYETRYGLTVQEDVPLFDARHVWTCNSGLQVCHGQGSSTVSEDGPVFESILLPLSLCAEAPMPNAHIALLALFLPQFLFLYERDRVAESFVRHSEWAAPCLGSYCRKLPMAQIATVLTAKSCSQDDNYDKWEWLGDGMLKLLQSDSLIKSSQRSEFIKFLHEGDLSMLRSAMGSNERLAKVCVRFGFDNFVMTSALSRRKWMPSPLRQRSISSGQEDSAMRKKTMADVVEALLGLLYIEFGYDASVKVCRELGLALDFVDLVDDSLTADSDNRDLQEVVKGFSGYEAFRRPQLLEEAFTHPSAIRTTVSSYQRLEWIGDAVVCLCVREWVFRHFAEELHLKDMVIMEDALVSNETLALLSMKHGLPHFLNHRDQTLPGRIQSYFLRVQGGNGLWYTDPPKTVSDVCESLLGAIHVDGGFAAGQAAAANALAPICGIIERARSNPAALLEIFTPPKRALQETTGELLDLISLNEAAFTSTFSHSTPVLYADRWVRPANDGTSHVSAVTMLEVLLLGVTDESLAISRNRACLILLKALDANPMLKQRLAECQSRIASATTSNLVDTDGEDASSNGDEQML